MRSLDRATTFASALLLIIGGFCKANDALFVVDLAVTNGQFVESAPIEIPAGYQVGFSYITGNRKAREAFYQGVKVEVAGLKFVHTDIPDDLPVPPSPFPDAPRFSTNDTQIYDLFGPCKISAFASNTPARLQVYLVASDPQNASGYLLGTNVHAVTVPAGQILRIQRYNYVATRTVYGAGFTNDSQLSRYYEPYVWAFTNTTTNRYSWGTFTNSYTNVGTNSSEWRGLPQLSVWTSPGAENKLSSYVVPSWFINRGSGVSPSSDIIGPAVVTFSVAMDEPRYGYSQRLGFYEYRLIPVNASYVGASTNSSTNTNITTPNNTPVPMSVTIERSTDRKSWSQVDSFYVTETAGEAYYRVRGGAVTASNLPTLGAVKVSGAKLQNLADALPADNDPAGDGLSERAKYALRDFGSDWENASTPSLSALAAANAAGLFSKKQHSDQRAVGRSEVIAKPSDFSLFNKTQYAANQLSGRSDVTANPGAFNLFTEKQYLASRAAGRADVVSRPASYNLISRKGIPPIRIAAQRGQKFSVSLPGSWTRYAQSGMPKGWKFNSKTGVLDGVMPQKGRPSVRLTPYRGNETGAQMTIEFQPTAR
jgi:hypothetical protein